MIFLMNKDSPSHEHDQQIVPMEAKRHTLAHLLAAAVLETYPDAKPTIGPAVDNGFYYDFEFKEPITEKDLKDLEKKMRKILLTWKTIAGTTNISENIARLAFKDNPYKQELISEITSKNEQISIYTSIPTDCSFEPTEELMDFEKSTALRVFTPLTINPKFFHDLCRGGHIKHPSTEIAPDSFKLSHIAGAYWRGDANNKMLTRIYGLAFNSKEELESYEKMMAEAEKRDHKKLGKELKLFSVSPLVGSGLPLIQPKGMIIRKEIEDYLWQLHRTRGYHRVWTPHIAKEELYITSGHAAKFGDELFKVQGKEEKFFMKPMNCPHHMQIFADNQFSYRDMPVRYFEPATVYRDEKSGQLAGLTRVRSITQDDGHLFCRVSQIKDEVSTIVEIIKKFYTTFGMMDGYWVSLSVRDSANKDKYLGSDEVWNTAESALETAANANGLNYRRVEGEATFYGPKLDFMFKDAIGRSWQLATIQCDFNLPERFDLSFANEKSEKERPVVIHRAISGSLERFMGIVIEHYAGNFPLWLSPVQVQVIPVAEAHFEAAKKIHEALLAAEVRADIDLSNDSFGKKIRNAKTDKIPYFIILGEKDIQANKVTLESRDAGEGVKGQQLDLNEVIEKFTKEIRERK
jgi:threonyl-tRNA synthetase